MVNKTKKSELYIKVIIEPKVLYRERGKANPVKYLDIRSRRRKTTSQLWSNWRRRGSVCVAHRRSLRSRLPMLWEIEGVRVEKIIVGVGFHEALANSLFLFSTLQNLGFDSYSNSTRFATSLLLEYSLCLYHPNLSHQEVANFATFLLLLPFYHTIYNFIFVPLRLR